MNSINLKSRAKINLGLQIIRRREDGFHDLNTIFAKICVFDQIELFKNTEIIVDCHSNIKINSEKNLAYRAAKLFQEKFLSPNDGVKINMKKKIPIGAGLGGGSSNAATVLLGLNQLYELGLTFDDLLPLGASLGSDVPFFLNNGAAEASGRGEILKYFRYQIPYWTLIVYPNAHVSTPWAYSQIDLKGETKAKFDFVQVLRDSQKDFKNLQGLFNDFEEPVFAHYPQIREAKETLIKNGALFAMMSGSGSSLFGFFEDDKKASAALSQLSNYQTFLCQPQRR